MVIDNSSKKVKFAYDPLIDNKSDDESNDLDLDTIKSSSRNHHSRGLKEFDSEGEDENENDLNEPEEDELNFNNDFDNDEEDSEEDDFESIEDERTVPIVPFNLKSDKEEGNFDADGFYTRKVDEDAHQDRWMANLTTADILAARKAHEKREKESLKRAEEGKERRSEIDLYVELAKLMEESSNDASVLDVLRS